MQVGTSSSPGAVFPACNRACETVVKVISGSGRLALGTAGESRGISPTSAWFWSRVLTRIALFSGNVVARAWPGDWGSLSGGERKLPIDLCHLLILKISLVWVAWLILVCQYRSLAFLMVLHRSFFIQALERYRHLD